MTNKVTNSIAEIKSGKYFFDYCRFYARYISYQSINVRYGLDNGSPTEHFLKFILNAGHSAKTIADAVTDTLNSKLTLRIVEDNLTITLLTCHMFITDCKHKLKSFHNWNMFFVLAQFN